MTPERLEYYILLSLLIIIGICLIFALVRAIRGPKIGDRIVAVNMVNTLAVIALADLAVIAGEGYLADVCILYAAIGFVAVTALCRVYLARPHDKKGGSEK